MNPQEKEEELFEDPNENFEQIPDKTIEEENENENDYINQKIIQEDVKVNKI
jgi:hypothetical protein